MNVLAFCADNPELSGTANSQNIIDCSRYPRPGDGEVSDDDYYYSWTDPQTGETKTLSDIEKAIYHKYKNDQSPIYHYPVITHIQTVHCEKMATFRPKIAMALDVVTKTLDANSGDECPFDTDGFEWLHTGSSINCQLNIDGSKDYTVEDIWWGAELSSDGQEGNYSRGWDGNFYPGGSVKDRYSDQTWELGLT